MLSWFFSWTPNHKGSYSRLPYFSPPGGYSCFQLEFPSCGIALLITPGEAGVSMSQGSLLLVFQKSASKIYPLLSTMLGPRSQGSWPGLWPFTLIDSGPPHGWPLKSPSYGKSDIEALINELFWSALPITYFVPWARHLSDQVLSFLKAGAEQAAQVSPWGWSCTPSEWQSHSCLDHSLWKVLEWTHINHCLQKGRASSLWLCSWALSKCTFSQT